MKEQLSNLLAGVKENTIPFVEVIAFIDHWYQHQPTAFKNGDTYNEANQNQGSARVFAFAQLNQLNQQDTLSLFSEHYRSVLAHPDATDHQNIRQFMAHGWAGIAFEGAALTPHQ
ncbi:HopJ type III effector protein [Deminuibacter soli]|uniref:HopJ type III effector protein n=1 Tax=Deminuibacter soli TaxID=2291815 RepID=A0A3E1NIM3_9BACT|nr:HopJ type III effector protein [Deminuibacter soli]RFM27777.1 HopJ type III effector protein [Deminuibacter soli]